MGLFLENKGSCYYVKGDNFQDTYKIKNTLKHDFKCKWNTKEKVWMLDSDRVGEFRKEFALCEDDIIDDNDTTVLKAVYKVDPFISLKQMSTFTDICVKKRNVVIDSEEKSKIAMEMIKAYHELGSLVNDIEKQLMNKSKDNFEISFIRKCKSYQTHCVVTNDKSVIRRKLKSMDFCEEKYGRFYFPSIYYGNVEKALGQVNANDTNNMIKTSNKVIKDTTLNRVIEPSHKVIKEKRVREKMYFSDSDCSDEDSE